MKRSLRNTFEEPYIHSGITRDYTPKKLKQGFLPINTTELQSVKTPSQAQLRQMFYPDGEPRLYKSRGNPSKVIMNAQMRDYQTEQAIDDLQKVKAHREHKYINTTEKYDKLEAYAGDEKFDKEIKTINQTLEQIYGLSKQERDDLKKLLLKDTITANMRGKSGLVIRKNKVNLPVMTDPQTGNRMTNKASALRLAARPEEDEDMKFASPQKIKRSKSLSDIMSPPDYGEDEEKGRDDVVMRRKSQLSGSEFQAPQLISILARVYNKVNNENISDNQIKKIFGTRKYELIDQIIKYEFE